LDPLRPIVSETRLPQSRFRRGKSTPRGVVWFGLRSFWGHLRHFIASAIATEDVDSRDWMTPDDPGDLARRIAEHLGSEGSGSLVEALDREIWIDYVADTGDDVEISEAVATLIFREYSLPDPEHAGREIRAPRGDILLFGGDTAYPVATVEEINNRVLVPFNRVLNAHGDSTPRVLLGIPGNHDWYDGLDGFARMFRRRFDTDSNQPLRPSLLPVVRNPLEHAADWTKQFIAGGQIKKQKNLVLEGYTAFQQASYFVLPLSPTIHLFAVDRQLKNIDYRQRHFFTTWQRRHPTMVPWVVMPDPVYAYCEPKPTGVSIAQSLELDHGESASFFLSGDTHHYQRFQYGNSLNVIAGGGGAFLHPAPVRNSALRFSNGATAAKQWPSSRQSKLLLWQVPWKIARGRSGMIPHLFLLILFTPVVLGFASRGPDSIAFPAAFALLLAILWPIYALIGGARRHGRRTGLFALVASALTVGLPFFGVLGLERYASGSTSWMTMLGLLIGAVFLGAWCFGSYLALLTLLGLENTQAFTALDHPGFKHFLRLRVRRDGRHVDGWCIGLTDPLATNAEPELVDRFTWQAAEAPKPIEDERPLPWRRSRTA
jgi:hypothetical protein